jgi:ferrous iron transport protein B
MDFFSDLFSPVLTGLWGLPKEAVSALVIGFLRKDVAVGMLGPLNLTDKQLVIGSTILAVYFPCIATYVNIARELGLKDLLKTTSIMILVALLTGALLNLIL